ncbi:hypothetical protein HY621_00640 [Candidatus Uhrbacteria bacterium]|nr:hypothetical protein [Candidatus Uhrbacteria bacterium]
MKKCIERILPILVAGSLIFSPLTSALHAVTHEEQTERRVIIDAQVAVTENEIQVGITGVGWSTVSKKAVTARDPLDQPYTPLFTDLCADAPCQDNPDGLKIFVSLGRSTPAGTHTFTVSEEGGSAEVKVEIPKLPENEEVAKLKPIITLVFPPVGTVDVFSIRVTGKDWGDYKKRRNVQAWLVDPDDTERAFELKVFRNYPPCTITIGKGKIVGGCSTSELDELSLTLEIPEGLKKDLLPKQYALYVRTENGLQAASTFRVIITPDFSKAKEPTIALSPLNRGPAGSAFVLTGGGFRSKEILSPWFDGIKLQVAGLLQADEEGRFDNVVSAVPKTLEIEKTKTKPVLPGEHTIKVSGGTGKDLHSATAIFIVEEGDVDEGETEKAKKDKEDQERIEKDRKEKERIDKEKEKIEQDRDKAEK